MRKLSNEEIKQIKSIEGINPKKSFIQNLIVEEWWKTKKGLIESYTGSGKSRIVTETIKKINREYPDYNIIIVSPTSKLEDDFNKKIIESDLKNTTSITTKSYSSIIKDKINKVDVLIVDEAHRVSNVSSELYSEIIPKTEYKFIMCLSATFEHNHLSFLKEQGLEVIFKFDISDGYRLKLVPDYTTYCIGVNLTQQEKEDYIKIQNEYDKYVAFFSKYDVRAPISTIMSVTQKKGKKYKYEGFYQTSQEHAKRIAKKLEMNEGSVVGVGMKWLACVNKRSTFLNNSKNLLVASLFILKEIVKDKIIVFCSNKENARLLQSQLSNSKCYYSGLSDKTLKSTLEEFENGDLQYLLTIKSLDEGYDLPNLRLGLQYSYTSKKLQFNQRKGRVNRFDENDLNKQSYFICLYIDHFEYNGVKVFSQQRKWLEQSLRGSDFVEWTTIKNIKL